MVVRLQTVEGKIKEYQTVYGVGSVIGGEVSGVDKWISKCGGEWNKMPEPHQECSHLECAIRAAEDWKFNLIFGLPFFGAIAAISFHFRDLEGLRGIFTLVSLAFAIGAIILLVLGLAGKSNWDELNEFKNNGTVKGIAAWQIHENPNIR
jgi:hypothetical protein